MTQKELIFKMIETSPKFAQSYMNAHLNMTDSGYKQRIAEQMISLLFMQ
jgi:hypothetical protein